METEQNETSEESKQRIIFRVEENDTPLIDLTDYSITHIHIDMDTSMENEIQLIHEQFSNEITISGNILMNETSEDDVVLKLINWAVLPASDKGCYKKVFICIKDENNVLLREESYDEVYVENYYEYFDCQKGTGTFLIKLKICNRTLKSTNTSS